MHLTTDFLPSFVALGIETTHTYFIMIGHRTPAESESRRPKNDSARGLRCLCAGRNELVFTCGLRPNAINAAMAIYARISSDSSPQYLILS